MKASLPLAAATALATVTCAAVSHAVVSTPAEFRGYQACLEANEAEFSGLSTQRNYLLTKTSNGRTYYINATAWQDGQRVKIAFSCDTTRSGTLINKQDVSTSHFVSAREHGVQVAGN